MILPAMLLLPGLYRGGGGFPAPGMMYYEWYLALDEDHYDYFQITAMYPKNRLHRWLLELKYYFLAKPAAIVMFNNGDASLVPQTTAFQHETGDDWVHHTKVNRNDDWHALWRQYCDEWARGAGTKWLEQRQQAQGALPVIAGASGDGPDSRR